MKRLMVTLLLLCGGTGFAAKVTEVKGEVVGDFVSLNVRITIKGIQKSEVKASASTTDLYNNLAISLPGYSNTNPILPSTKATQITQDKTNAAFIWEGTGANLTQDDTDPQLYMINFSIIVRSNSNYSPTVALKTISNVSIDVQAQFVQLLSNGNYDDPLGNASLATKAVGTIRNILTSPKDAPTGFTVGEADRGVLVSWKKDIKVKYVPTSSPEIEQVPDQVLIMVFDNAAVDIDLNANDAGSAIPYTANTSCKFNSGAIGTSTEADCIECTSPGREGTWITDTKPENAGAVFWQLVDNVGSFTVPNLTPRENYTVVLQFKRGIQRTICKQGIPYRTNSLTERNGGAEAREGDPRCFIVSAAFGSPFNKHVDIFRWARDRFLEPFDFGHQVVEFYYDHSQPFADLIKTSPELQVTTRALLYPLALLLYILQELGEYPTLVFSFGALILCFLGMRRWKLRHVR